MARVYRKPGTALEGTVVAVSPNREVTRVRLDEVADSWIRTEHLIAIDTSREPRRRFARSRSPRGHRAPVTA